MQIELSENHLSRRLFEHERSLGLDDIVTPQDRLAVSWTADDAESLLYWLAENQFEPDADRLGWDFRRLNDQLDDLGFDSYRLARSLFRRELLDQHELQARWQSFARDRLPSDKLLIDEADSALVDGWAAPPAVVDALSQLASVADERRKQKQAAAEREEREETARELNTTVEILDAEDAYYAAQQQRRDAVRRESWDEAERAGEEAERLYDRLGALKNAEVVRRIEANRPKIDPAEAEKLSKQIRAMLSNNTNSGAVKLRTAASLQHQTFTPVRYVVDKYVAEGCSILAGKPKMGKSWLMLDVALAVASGGYVLGTKAVQGDVLYLALEDNERRLQTRIKKVSGPFVEWPERLTYATEWPRADANGVEEIEKWIGSVRQPALIVVDVLQRFRTVQSGTQNAYAADYAAVEALQRVASKHNLAIVVVHHLRKNAADSDPFDKVSGTLGLSGAADSILILDRDGAGGVVLYARGRDIEEVETAVKFNPVSCRWNVLGDAQDVRKSDERKKILSALGGSDEPMKPADIAAATGMSGPNVRRLIYKMAKDGEVEKDGTGYVPSNTGHSGHAVTPVMPSQQIIWPPAKAN